MSNVDWLGKRMVYSFGVWGYVIAVAVKHHDGYHIRESFVK
jgi:hypothetical protein